MHGDIGGGHPTSKHVGTLVEHEVAATHLAELLRDLVVREVVAIEKRMISAVENQPSMLHSGGEDHVAVEVPAVLNKSDYEIARRNSAFEKCNVFCNGIILAI